MKHLISIMILWLAVMQALVMAQEPTIMTAQLKDKCEDIIFLGDNVLLAANYNGVVKKTTRLEAFTVPELQELWSAEIPAGNWHRLSRGIWSENGSGMLYVGNGPLTAIDTKTGQKRWSIKYEDVGMVHQLLFGTDQALVLGTEKKSGFRITLSQESAMDAGGEFDHSKDPILFCINKSDGAVIWSHKFEHGKEHKKKKTDYLTGTKSVYKDFEPTRLLTIPQENRDSAPNISTCRILLLANVLECLDGATGKVIWTVDERIPGIPILVEDRILVIKKNKLCLLSSANGQVIWESKEKVNSMWAAESPLMRIGSKVLANVGKRLCAFDIESGRLLWKSDKDMGDFTQFIDTATSGRVLCLYPGEYEIGADSYKGKWLISCVSLDDGKTVWQFDKGEKYQGHNLREDGKLGILCDKAWWLIGLSDGKPVTQLKIPGDCQVLTDAPSPVYVTTGGLRCFSQDGRKEQWKLKANLTTDGLESVFYTKSTIVMPTKDKGIIGVDIDNCTTRWQIPMPKASPAIPSPSLKYLALPNGKDLRLIEISQRL